MSHLFGLVGNIRFWPWVNDATYSDALEVGLSGLHCVEYQRFFFSDSFSGNLEQRFLHASVPACLQLELMDLRLLLFLLVQQDPVTVLEAFLLLLGLHS